MIDYEKLEKIGLRHIIAERSFIVVKEGKESAGTLRIGKPFDDNGINWWCFAEIETDDARKVAHAGGIDAVQTLELIPISIQREIDALEDEHHVDTHLYEGSVSYKYSDRFEMLHSLVNRMYESRERGDNVLDSPQTLEILTEMKEVLEQIEKLEILDGKRPRRFWDQLKDK